MFSTKFTVFVLLGVGIFVLMFSENQAYGNNVHDLPFPIELLPENEYLIGSETPVYFLKHVSNEMKVSMNIIGNIFDTEQRRKYQKADTTLLNILPQDKQRIFVSRPDIDHPNNTIRPEILIIVDYDLYSRFEHDAQSIVAYVIAFWNAVDLKFRTLHSPSYRLNIAGIIVGETVDALSYIESFKYSKSGVDFVSARNSLMASADWLFENQEVFPLSHYDMAVTMTSNVLGKQSGYMEEHNLYKEKVCGVTFHAQACHDIPSRRKSYKTAIIYNEGAFDRVLAAANTISHLMSISYSSRYRNYGGSIMTDVSEIITSSDWTEAQINSLQNFIGDEHKSYCLKNTPVHGEKLPTLLPGMMMDANEQCKRMGFTMAKKIDASICRLLQCIHLGKPWYEYVSETEAADGTTCGDDKICLHSECISIFDENAIIPMYSYQSYL